LSVILGEKWLGTDENLDVLEKDFSSVRVTRNLAQGPDKGVGRAIPRGGTSGEKKEWQMVFHE